jgi:hypothetical protein
MGPLTYLTLCSLRNRLWIRLKRLRQPRYFIGLIVGVAYFYFLFWRPRPSPSGGGPGGALAAMGHARPNVELIGAAVLFLITALAWVWPSKSRPALAFSRADVQFLFPAPFTRRQLIRYRVLRSQLGVVIGSAFMTLFLRPTSAANACMFFLGVSIIMAVINLHLTGVSLSRESLGTHGVSALARQWLPLLVVGSAFAVLAGTIVMNWAPLSALESGSQLMAALGQLVSTGAAGIVLWPFRMVVKLPLAEVPADFVRTLPAALAILLLNYAWVVRSDAAFEEASAELAEKVARIRKGPRPTAPRPTAMATPFTLALQGRPETAILWKNLILVSRYVSLKTLWRWLPLLVILAVLLARGGADGGIGKLVRMLCFFVYVLAVVMGPQLARNDLRQDLTNLAVLRTWPVSGAALVRGEVLAPAVILTTVAWLSAVVGWMFATGDKTEFEPPEIAAAILLAPGIIVVQLLIQNVVAIVWPSWVIVNPRQARGIDVMGQRMIMIVGLILALVVAVLPAAIAAFAVGLGIYWVTGAEPFLLLAFIAGATMLVEAYIGSELAGRLLERTDVSQLDAAES